MIVLGSAQTRLLVTHGITSLPQVDQIIVLKDGEISEVGSYKELLTQKGAFAEFLLEHLDEADDEDAGPSAITFFVLEVETSTFPDVSPLTCFVC